MKRRARTAPPMQVHASRWSRARYTLLGGLSVRRDAYPGHYSSYRPNSVIRPRARPRQTRTERGRSETEVRGDTRNYRAPQRCAQSLALCRV